MAFRMSKPEVQVKYVEYYSPYGVDAILQFLDYKIVTIKEARFLLRIDEIINQKKEGK